MNRQIGAQFYTIREQCQTLTDFAESCRKVSEMGYKVVQLSGIGDFTGEEIKEILEKYDLKCACTHRAPAKYLDNLEEEIAFHKMIGCEVCGLGSMPGFNAKMETIEGFAEKFGPVCARLEEEGLIFAYHNHAFEFEKIDGKYAFEILFEKMPYKNFKLILDVYWLAFAGINPAKFIRDYKDYIACIHYKDLKIAENVQKFAEIGQGNLDWEDIISASYESSAVYALVEQDTCEGDPFASLKISYDFLKTRGFE